MMWFFLMLLFHVIDDYFLQGMCLCNLKQKSWWEKNAPESIYKYDYLMGLLCHCLSWSIMIMIPTMISGNFIWWIVPINLAVHFAIDDLKANYHRINLIEDQMVHFTQIILTYLACYIWMV